MTVAHIVTNLTTLTLPADEYHLVFSAEGMLVGTRSGLINGLVPTAIDFGDADVPAGFRRLFDDIDMNLPRPVDEEIQFIEYDGHKIAFLPAPGMGNNHAGWFDGSFFIPSAFYRELENIAADAGYDFDPVRLVVQFDDDVTISLDPDNSVDLNLIYGYRFNDTILREPNVTFAGSVEML